MPLYDYQCRTCKTVHEVRHAFREAYEGVCPSCGGAVARVFNPAGIVFKGSGFYVTDSRKGSGSSDSSASSAPASTPPSTSGAPASTPAAPASGSGKGESAA